MSEFYECLIQVFSIERIDIDNDQQPSLRKQRQAACTAPSMTPHVAVCHMQVFGQRPASAQAATSSLYGTIDDATRWGGMFERLHASYLDPNGVWRVYTRTDGPSEQVDSLQVRGLRWLLSWLLGLSS